LGASFPEETRDLARRAAVLGMRLADKAREIGAEGWERGQDILAEAEAERAEERRHADTAGRGHLTVMEDKPASRPRATAGAAPRARGARASTRPPARSRRTRPVDSTEN
ncbi:MAG: hypothetical protein M3010_10015, partial [Candidatus Dormibacteraeota bacterium]|nr:hypothetical protein [Candidatus Dormibacteraeota bacterium]